MDNINSESIKKIKVYDTFLFYNELDLLEIRLNILNDYVDYFVIIEAEETFSGIKKPLYYNENKERYKKWSDKIIHFVVDTSDEKLWNFSKMSPNVGAGEHWWVREFYQKENILKAIKPNKLDLVFVSDLDEIWDPTTIFASDFNYELNEVYRPIQTAFHYYLNNRSNQDINGWVGTRFGTYQILKAYGANHFRTERVVSSVEIKNGGWHFSNLGDFKFIKTKLEAYGHQEFNNEVLKNKISDCIKNNVDFLNRGFLLWKDETILPKFLIENKEKYKHLFL